MILDWSKYSSHIRTLYAPWRAGDGYEEAVIASVEAQLATRLPPPLRCFYRAWGRRKDMTQTNQYLLAPADWVIQRDACIFCIENQASCCWAILHQEMEQVDPPVVMADALPDWEWSEPSAPLTWMPSHALLSNFLDTLTYHHALCGGALHGGWTEFFEPQAFQRAWLEKHWNPVTVGPMVFGLVDAYKNAPPLHVRRGQALAWLYGCSAATNSVEALAEIASALQVTWILHW